MPPKKDSEWKLEIHQLDIVQGDSALILFKKKAGEVYEIKKAIMIDGGRGDGSNLEYLERYVSVKIGREERYYEALKELELSKNKLSELRKKTFKVASPQGKTAKTKNDSEIKLLEEKVATLDHVTIPNLKQNPSNLKVIDAIITTHDDVDHVGGVSGMLKSSSAPIGVSTKFIIQSGKVGGEDAVYQELVGYVGKGLATQNDKDQATRNRIIFAYNKIGKSIWEVLGEANKPNGAPDIEFLASDGSFLGDEALNLHDKTERLNLAKMENDNNGSVVSLIKMDNFRYYTAGDFETNRNLIEYLQLKEKALNGQVKYLPIQAFLVPHHGSRKNFPGAESKNPMFVNAIRARVALISAGGTTHYEHPHEATTDTLDKSNTSFVYMTNKARHEVSTKFVVPAKDDIKRSRGTIRVQTYQNITDEGQEQFMVKHRDKVSKTRDYFKDKDFAKLKEDLFKIMESFDKNNNTLLKPDLAEGENFYLYLNSSDLKGFLSPGKDYIKHLNPATLKKLFEKYQLKEDNNKDYKISFSIKEDVISFFVKSLFFYKTDQDNSRSYDSSKEALDRFTRIKDLNQTIGSGQNKSFGIFLSKNEVDKFQKNGGLTDLLKQREVESTKKDFQLPKDRNYFLEVLEPKHKSKEIQTKVLERQERDLLKKEYHKGKATPDKTIERVVARRVEYGEKEDRKI